MANTGKQFLDASGLNQYTKALKNGTLIVGKAVDASNALYAIDASNAKYAKDASTAFYASHASATGLIGTVPLANLPAGAIDKLVKVLNAEERLALTTEDVQNGDSVQELDTKNLYLVVDDTKLETEHAADAFVEYTAGRAAFAQDASHADQATHALTADDASTAKLAYEVAWNNVTGKPEEFKPLAHTHGAADVSTLAGYTESTAEGDERNIDQTDDLLTALGKLEKKADDAAAEAGDHTHTSDKIVEMTGYSKGASYSPIDTDDTLNEAIGKLEKLAVDSSIWTGIGGKPEEFVPEAHDAAKVTSLQTYSKDASTGDINTSDTLVTALAKLENKAEAGADEPIDSNTINAIINQTWTPTA